MKIHFTPKDFLRLFKLAANAAAARDLKPILQNVKIVADKKVGAILMATDTAIGIRIRVDVDVTENGMAVLPIKTLRTILESSREHTLTMESGQADRTVSVYGATERHELCIHDPDEFPNVEDFTAESYHEIHGSALQTMIRRTIFAIDKDNPRYAFGGVCFSSDDHTLIAVATDGRRLAVQPADITQVCSPKIDDDPQKDGQSRGLIVPVPRLLLPTVHFPCVGG